MLFMVFIARVTFFHKKREITGRYTNPLNLFRTNGSKTYSVLMYSINSYSFLLSSSFCITSTYNSTISKKVLKKNSGNEKKSVLITAKIDINIHNYRVYVVNKLLIFFNNFPRKSYSFLLKV